MTTPVCRIINLKPGTKDKLALITPEASITYAQLFTAAEKLARRFKSNGVLPNDRIAFITGNTTAQVVTLLALWSVKAVACPMSPRLPQSALKRLVKDINAQLIGSFNIRFGRASNLDLRNPDLFTYMENQPATIIYTSGTGSRPKAVLHTIGNHMTSAQWANKAVPLGPGDRWLLSLPLYHVSGLGILFRCLAASATIAVPGSNQSLWRSVAALGVTHLSLVPTQLDRLLRDLSGKEQPIRIKAILVGGATSRAALMKEAYARGLPIYITYGMTETASQIATGRYPTAPTLLGHCQLRITRDDEILVKGKSLCAGYVHGEKIINPANQGGWFATGDLGKIDKHGDLTVYGRKDNMFTSGGENIQPEEIERCLLEMENIEAAVVVPVKNYEFGFRPVAFIKGHVSKVLTRSALNRYLSKHLPKFKIPDRYYTWPDTPDQSGIKISRQYFHQLTVQNPDILQEIK